MDKNNPLADTLPKLKTWAYNQIVVDPFEAQYSFRIPGYRSWVRLSLSNTINKDYRYTAEFEIKDIAEHEDEKNDPDQDHTGPFYADMEWGGSNIDALIEEIRDWMEAWELKDRLLK
jgi:hypothetical protein